MNTFKYLIVTFLVLASISCDLKSEFDVNPTDFFMQKKVSAASVLGFDPPNVSSSNDFSMRGFLLGDEPYFAIKTNFSIESVPGVYIIDKDLHLVRKLTQAELSYGGNTWDPSKSFWNLAGSITGKSIYLNFGSGFYMPDVNWQYFYVDTSVYESTYFFNKNQNMARIGNLVVGMDDGGPDIQLYSTDSQIFGSSNATFWPGVPSFPLSVSDANGGFLPGAGHPTQDRKVFEYDNNLVVVLPTYGLGGTSNCGLPLFNSTKIEPLTWSNIISISIGINSSFLDPTIRVLNPQLNQEKDGAICYDSEKYIDSMAFVSGGLILPYPSGRDRLFDPVSGQLLFTFDVSVQNQNDNSSSKDRYNHPRAYVSGKDVWFMYDQDTKELKRLAGWWL